MRTRIFVFLAVSFVLFALAKPDAGVGANEQEIDPQRDFRERLERLAKLPPDACLASARWEKGWNPEDTEYNLFSRGADIIVQELNAPSANHKSAKEGASDALSRLEGFSGKINAEWPEDNRFHYEVLDVPPILVVKMTVRTSATYFAFAVPEQDASGKANLRWQEVGSDDMSLQQDSPRSLVELFPLQRGPSGNARFLARMEPFGCAGSTGIVYDGREWDPEGIGGLSQIISQTGSLGLDDQVAGFEWVGHLQTEGQLVTLPYCWFSAIDTWDNPSLCAADTYDLSGDDVRFQSRVFNRPDLVPIAKVIEYAQHRDYGAVEAYCSSRRLAFDLVQNFPAQFFADDLRITKTGSGRERVEMGDDPIYRFDVEEHARGWVVSNFAIE
jgi:hypothetical protein